MKFTPEVVAALEVLRAAAENDFEQHRIDVLERDLTSPPTVEVVDEKHQRFNGVVYNKDKSGHYRINFSIQQAVWRYYHGEIPEGHHIHHVNGNKDDNNAGNFQLLTKSEHTKLHRETFQMPPRQKETFQCIVCGGNFEAVNCGNNHYCSNHCRNIHVKEVEHYKETRTCVVCGKNFTASKFSETVCCSYSCAKIFGWAKRKANVPPIRKICAYCGAEFGTYSVKAKFCSKRCSNRAYREANR